MDKRITNSNWERVVGLLTNKPKKGEMAEIAIVGRYSLDRRDFMEANSVGIQIALGAYKDFIQADVEQRLKKGWEDANPLLGDSYISHTLPGFGETKIFAYQAIWYNFRDLQPTIRINEEVNGKVLAIIQANRDLKPGDPIYLSDLSASNVKYYLLAGREMGLPYITFLTYPNGKGEIFWDLRANKLLSSRLLWQAREGTGREKEEAYEMAWEESKAAVMGMLHNMGITFALERKYNEEAAKDLFREWFFYTAGYPYGVDGKGMTRQEWVGDGSKWLPSSKMVLKRMKQALLKLNKPMLVSLDTVEEETQITNHRFIYLEDSIPLSEEFLLEEKIDYVKKGLVRKGLPQQRIKRVEDAIRMKFVDENLTNEEIGKKLGVSEATVRRLLKLAQDNWPRE